MGRWQVFQRWTVIYAELLADVSRNCMQMNYMPVPQPAFGCFCYERPMIRFYEHCFRAVYCLCILGFACFSLLTYMDFRILLITWCG